MYFHSLENETRNGIYQIVILIDYIYAISREKKHLEATIVLQTSSFKEMMYRREFYTITANSLDDLISFHCMECP